MKLLILGGGGMLGHKLWLTASPLVETWATLRDDGRSLPDAFDRGRVVPGVYAEQFDTVIRAFGRVRPDVVVNCIGIVKQHAGASDPIAAITVNSLFPHRVAALCAASGARFVHVSTDCVFSGRRGGYTEQDVPDAVDLYGRTKQLGEVSGPGSLTLRTSMIGRELRTSHGLVEWFIAQRGRDGTVPGYTKAVFSGLTTAELSRVILRAIDRFPGLTGVYHVAAEPIAKHDLLGRLNRALGRNVTIAPDISVQIDRSLDGRRFAAAAEYTAPGWDRMIDELAGDAPAYDTWRQHAR
jgi:dTDP-4-dehydrorhamnose reductase